jgi:serine protease AprX
MSKRLVVFFALLLLGSPGFCADVAPSVRAWTAVAAANEELVVWVFLRDKGPLSVGAEQASLARLEASYPAKTVGRRQRARPGRPFDRSDLPLYGPYLKTLKGVGVEFRAFSKWINAASVVATPDQIKEISGLDFVKRIAAVGGRRSVPEPGTTKAERPEGPLDEYGPCYTQLDQIQVTDLHAEGLTGAGIVVAIFDTGFWLEHESLASVSVLAEHDFINDDDTTANQPGDDPGQHDHGTMCLSLLAGHVPGVLMGAAYEAQYILAKTEDITDEQPVEEDWWIEAAEWADSLGADVISSSLCYNDWYTYSDMDGNTAPITIAADQAAVNGIAVVNAAGNSGSSAWKYILAPADGDSVISAGAVDSTGQRAYFSSLGPTYDGRIKPTIMAMGQSTFIADPADAHGYRYGSGTSFACPLAAGAVALILEKNPGWSSGEIIEAVTATGTQASEPDTLCGWGILQAYEASEYVPLSGVAGLGEVPSIRAYPNPCTAMLTIRCATAGPGSKVRLYDVRGRLIRTVVLDCSGTATLSLDDPGPRPAAGIVFVTIPGSRPVKVVVVE